MKVNLTIAKKTEEIYMDSMNNLTIQAALRQAKREFEERNKKRDDFKRTIKEIIH